MTAKLTVAPGAQAVSGVPALSRVKHGGYSNSCRYATGRLAHRSRAGIDCETDWRGRIRDERRRGAARLCGRVRVGGGHTRKGPSVSSFPRRANRSLDQATQRPRFSVLKSSRDRHRPRRRKSANGLIADKAGRGCCQHLPQSGRQPSMPANPLGDHGRYASVGDGCNPKGSRGAEREAMARLESRPIVSNRGRAETGVACAKM